MMGLMSLMFFSAVVVGGLGVGILELELEFV